jgi:hypothetical protein
VETLRLTLRYIGPDRYLDTDGDEWQYVKEETCAECGQSGCFVGECGDRLCSRCLEEQFDVIFR